MGSGGWLAEALAAWAWMPWRKAGAASLGKGTGLTSRSAGIDIVLLELCLGTAKSSLEGGAVGIFHARGSVVHTVTALGIALALKIWAELVHGGLAT